MKSLLSMADGANHSTVRVEDLQLAPRDPELLDRIRLAVELNAGDLAGFRHQAELLP